MTEKKSDGRESVNRRSVLGNVDDPERHVDNGPGSRRGFVGGLLGTVGAALASTVGFTGASVANEGDSREQAVRAARRYSSKADVRRVVAQQTTDLRTALADEGVLDTAAADELLQQDLLSVGEYLDADEGMVVFGTIHDGTATARIEIARQFSSHELKVTVYPETGETYATVRSDAPDRPDHQVVRAETTSEVTAAQDDCYCDPYTTCDAWYDSGGQRWCVGVYYCDPGGSCDPVCDSADHGCSTCSDIC